MAGGRAVPIAPSAPNPALATVLGFIPGVGAMYNGQYVKAIVHVLVFVVLVGMAANAHGVVGIASGIFIPAWIFYQVFDAYHTARARRFGMVLPDPFGLNDLENGFGNRIGLQNSQIYTPPFDPVTGEPRKGVNFVADAGQRTPGSAGFVGGNEPPQGAYQAYPPMDAGYPIPPPDLRRARREPIGAIVLIGLGMLFLFNSLGIFEFNWVGRGWPLILIGIGVWLLIQRTRGMAKSTGGQP